MVTTIVNCLLLAGVVPFVGAQSGLITTISSDTTWTKADGSHSFTGNYLVDEGVTLTIEAGVTVNLNDYEMRVKGTLVVRGSASEPVHFNNGLINVTESSVGWNMQTDSGFFIEHAVLDHVDLLSSVSLKMVDSIASVYCEINVAKSSILLGNTLNKISISGDPIMIENNNLTRIKLYDCSMDLTGNKFNYITLNGGSLNISDSDFNSIVGYCDSLVVTNSTFEEIGNYRPGNYETKIEYLRVTSAVITNNIIEKFVYLTGHSSLISNNLFLGYVHGYDLVGQNFCFVGFSPISFSPIISSNSAEISNNTITGRTYRYTYEMNTPYTTRFDDTVTTIGMDVNGAVNVLNNTISDCETAIDGGATIEGNTLHDNHNGILVVRSDVVVRNNVITNGEKGIHASSDATAIIENNIIKSHSDYGISIAGQSTVLNNTITNTAIAIKLVNCPVATINYNNIEGYTENSIYLSGNLGNVDATNNWWGTTDSDTIGVKIYDSKYSFDLGTVTFTPFLTEPNPEATPLVNPEIPEFSSWFVLPLFLVATLFVVFCGKRFSEHLKRS